MAKDSPRAERWLAHAKAVFDALMRSLKLGFIAMTHWNLAPSFLKCVPRGLAFWTGEEFLAVEIDGKNQMGTPLTYAETVYCDAPESM